MKFSLMGTYPVNVYKFDEEAGIHVATGDRVDSRCGINISLGEKWLRWEIVDWPELRAGSADGDSPVWKGSIQNAQIVISDSTDASDDEWKHVAFLGRYLESESKCIELRLSRNLNTGFFDCWGQWLHKSMGGYEGEKSRLGTQATITYLGEEGLKAWDALMFHLQIPF